MREGNLLWKVYQVHMLSLGKIWEFQIIFQILVPGGETVEEQGSSFVILMN